MNMMLFLLSSSMLGHLYCAEALTMLDRIGEARTYLEPKFIAELKEDDFIHRGSPGKRVHPQFNSGSHINTIIVFQIGI